MNPFKWEGQDRGRSRFSKILQDVPSPIVHLAFDIQCRGWLGAGAKAVFRGTHMNRLKKWEGGIPAFVGWMVSCIGFYPGLLNNDSRWQLEQAVQGVYFDWHPPIMSFVWRYLLWIRPGEGSIFLFHVTLFWIGFGLFIHYSIRSRWLGVLWVLLVSSYLPLLCAFGAIGKDGGVLGGLVFACGMLLSAEVLKCKKALMLAMLGLIYVTCIRQNAFVGALPLCLWAGRILQRILPHKSAGGRGALFGLACFV